METQQRSILDNGKAITMLFVLFIIALTLLSIFSNKLSFHDDMEYIVVAKDLAGFENSKVFSSHSIVYPFIISLFLRMAFSEITLKLVNMIWFILIALVLFKLSSRKSLLLWIFAPIAYILFPQTSPTAPAAFFILLGYLMIKKYEGEQKRKYFIFSALCLGMSFALYTPSILPIILFILAFFYDKKLTNLFYYLIWMLPTIAITLILDYIYFGNPFYSIIWYMGANVLIALGLNQNIAFSQISSLGVSILFFLFGISPLLFKIVKLDFKKYKRELIIIVPLVLFFIFRAAAQLKYMLLIAPIILILLSTVLTKKQIIISAVISLIIIPLVIYPYFGETNDTILKEDLKSIKQDFNPEKALAGENLAMTLAGLQFNDSIYIVWPEELKEEILKTYRFEIKPKSNTLKYLTFSSDLKLNNPEKDKNLLLLERKSHASSQYKEIKCYKELCVYGQS